MQTHTTGRAARLLAAAFATAVSGYGASAQAPSRFDDARPIYIEGIIAEAAWSPLRSQLVLRVGAASAAPPGDLPEIDDMSLPVALGDSPARELLGGTVRIDVPGIPRFRSLPGRIALGDRVAVIAHRNCSPPHQLRAHWVRLASGAVVKPEDRPRDIVNGCRGEGG